MKIISVLILVTASIVSFGQVKTPAAGRNKAIAVSEQIIITNNIRQAYLIALGINPTPKQIEKLRASKRPDPTSLGEIIVFLGTSISNNRGTVQKDLIRRAYFSVFREYPNSQNLEDLYASTEKKNKNYTEFVNDFRTFFKDSPHEPE